MVSHFIEGDDGTSQKVYGPWLYTEYRNAWDMNCRCSPAAFGHNHENHSETTAPDLTFESVLLCILGDMKAWQLLNLASV